MRINRDPDQLGDSVIGASLDPHPSLGAVKPPSRPVVQTGRSRTKHWSESLTLVQVVVALFSAENTEQLIKPLRE